MKMHTLKPLKLIPVMIGVLVLVGCTSQTSIDPVYLKPNSVIYQLPETGRVYAYNLDTDSHVLLPDKGLNDYSRQPAWIKQTDDTLHYQFITVENNKEPNPYIVLHSLASYPEWQVYTAKDKADSLNISSDISLVMNYTKKEDYTELSVLRRKDNKKIIRSLRINGNVGGHFLSDDQSYLFIKTYLVGGSTPEGDLAIVNLKEKTVNYVDIPEYFTQPYISPNGRNFIISNYHAILGDGTQKQDGYSLNLYDTISAQSETIIKNDLKEYVNINWNQNGNKFLFQEHKTYHVGQSINTAEIDQFCGEETSVYEYDLISKSLMKLSLTEGNECIQLFGYNPSNNSQVYYQIKGMGSSYSFWMMDIETGVKKNIFEMEDPFNVYSLSYIPNEDVLLISEVKSTDTLVNTAQ